MTIADNIRPDHRVTAIGKTRSGKSYWVRDLIRRVGGRYVQRYPYYRVLVFNTKPTKSYDGIPAVRFRNGARFAKADQAARERGLWVLHYRPGRDEADPEAYDELIGRAMERGYLTIVLDEIAHINEGRANNTGANFRYAMKAGGELGVGVWGLTQTPSFVPHETLSEQEHVAVFRLKEGYDQDKARGLVGKGDAVLPDGRVVRAPEIPFGEEWKHAAWYRNDDMEQARLYKSLV